MNYSEARKILGVEKSASMDEIKKAFRRLSMKYHPDRDGGSEEKFKELNSAYEVLKSSELGGISNKSKHGAFDDIFGFKSSYKAQGTIRRVQFPCTLDEVFNGCTKSVTINGINGWAGAVRQIIIEPGTTHNQVVDIFTDEESGDATYVHLQVEVPDGIDVDWNRTGGINVGTVTMQTKISPFKLIKGGYEDIKLFDGTTVRVYIPPRTQPNTLLKVKDKGYWSIYKYRTRGACLLRVIPDIKDFIEYSEEEILDMMRSYMSALKNLPPDQFLDRANAVVSMFQNAVQPNNLTENNEKTDS